MNLQQQIKQLYQQKKYRPVGVFVLHNSDKELLIYQSAKNLDYWGFLQGGIDLGETPQEVFYRETNEEAGVEKEELGVIQVATNLQLLNSPIGRKKRDGFYRGKAYLLMVAEYFGGNNFIPQQGEVETVKWVDFDGARKHFSKLRPKKSDLLLDYLEQVQRMI